MIELKHICKTFDSGGGEVEALKDVSLTIEKGEVYGIIGMSGAGKSTLVRCMNLLERPTSGEIWVDGQELEKMSEEKRAFSITNEDGVFIVTAAWLAPILYNCNMEDYESLQYFQRVLRQSGIIDELENMGIEEDDVVSIYDFEFNYVR